MTWPPPALAPGELRVDRNAVYAGTGTVPVRLGDVQPQGKRRMPAADWARGLHAVGPARPPSGLPAWRYRRRGPPAPAGTPSRARPGRRVPAGSAASAARRDGGPRDPPTRAAPPTTSGGGPRP